MTTTEARMTASGPAPLIEELFCQGHPLEHVVAVGQDVGWSRADVMAVLRDRQWDLDGSGRLPRSKRVTVPQGLRAARPLPPAAPPTRARRPLSTPARPRPAVVDGPSMDEWTGPDAVDVDPPAVDDPPAPPARPSGAVFSAIADWADDETPTDAPPPAAEQPQQQPSSRAEPRPRRAAAILPPDADAAVARFLAERTVQAPDGQFLTSPALRDAYEAWRVWDGAPAVTPRQFGSVLTARYRKKQSPVPIEGVKPMCYFGLAWKAAEALAAQEELGVSADGAPDDLVEDDDHDARHPHWIEGCGDCVGRAEHREAERPTERRWLPPLDDPRLPTMTASITTEAAAAAEKIREQVDAMTPRANPNGSINAQHVALELTLRGRAGLPSFIAALDGPGKYLPPVEQPAAVRPAEVNPLEPVVTADQVAEVHAELVTAAASEPVAPPVRVATVDLLAVGLTHSDRRVRAAAVAVERAVDVLCAALRRVSA